MSWWSLLPGAVALLVLVLLPGALALRLLGIRGLAGLAAAAPVTLSAIGALSVLLAAAGIPWRLPAVVVSLAVALLALAGAGWLVTRRHTPDEAMQPSWGPGPLGARSGSLVTLAVAVGVIALAAPLVLTLPSPDAPLQQWDGVFHLNAVAVARDTGVITPLGGLAPLYGDGTLAPYYPTGWHAVLAITPALASVPAASNVGIIVLGIVVWVVGLAGLAREVFAQRALPAVLSPLLAATFVAYPAVQLTVLAQLANGLSTALLPGALLLVLRLIRAVKARAAAHLVAGAVMAAAAGVAGVVVGHASGLFSLAVLAGPLLLGALGGWALHMVRRGRRWAGGGVLAALVLLTIGLPVVLANLDALAAVVGFERASGRSHGGALLEVLLDQTLVHSYPGDGWQHVAISLATILGAGMTLWLRRYRWLTAAFALAVGLAVLASGPEDHPLRWLSGFWYTQAGRIAPVAVVPAVLLAALAATALLDRARRHRHAAVATAASATVVVIVMATVVLRMPVQERVIASAFVPGEVAWGTMATSEELAMMRRLPDVLPSDAVVVGDPFNGSALLPAVAGVDVAFPQLGASGLSEAHRTVQNDLSQIHDAAVCEAIEELGASHLYQDTAEVTDGAKVDDRTAGMRDVDTTSGFTQVESAGSAAVYRIDVCDTP